MGDLFFKSGQKIDFSTLRSGIQIDENNIFLKKYDTNNNSIFDTNELNVLRQDLETYSGEDRTLDEKESISLFAKVMNITYAKAQELFNKKQSNVVYDSINSLFEEQAEENAIQNIKSEAQMSMQIYVEGKGGRISQIWNSIKEIWDDEYCEDKVYRQIADKQVTAMLLEKAERNGGISKKDYIETKIEFLKLLLGGDNLLPADEKMIETAVMNMTAGELDQLITTLKDAESSDYNNVVQKTLQDLAQKGYEQNDGYGFTVTNPNSIKALLESEEASKLLEFKDVYLLENNVAFNPEEINKYAEMERNAKITVTINNRIASLIDNLAPALKELDNTNKYGGIPEEVAKKSYIQLSNSIMGVLEDLYGSRAIEVIKELGYPDAKITNGIIDFGNGYFDNYALVDLGKQIKNNLESKIQTKIDGKPIEEYEADLKSQYTKAYGTKNTIDLANEFKSNQEMGVSYGKAIVTGAGLVMCIFSGGQLIPVYAGMGLSAFGSAAISYAEASTKQGGMTEQDKEEIKQEIITSIALLGAGGAISKISGTIGKELIKRCPKLVAAVGEYGSDAVMSLMADLAITGEIDISGEGISQLINIATGIHAGRKVQDYTVDTQHTNNNYMKKITSNDIHNKTLNKTDVEDYIMELSSRFSHNLDNQKLKNIANNLYEMKKNNSPLYQDIESSGLLKLVEEGKIDFKVLEDLCIKTHSNTRMSKELYEDCKKLNSGEPYIKEYLDGSDLKTIYKNSKNGEVVEIGSDLYINDGHKMVKLNISKEKYLELFPPFKRFDINQNESKYAGNCWFLETAHNLYQNPSMRVEILKLFRQEGNDIYVKLPDSKFEYKFQNGDVPKNHDDAKYYLSDSPKWINMLEYVGALSRRVNGISKESSFNIDVLKKNGVVTESEDGHLIFDLSSYLFASRMSGNKSGILYNLYSGSPEEAIEMLTDRKKTVKKYSIDKSHEYTGANVETNKNKIQKQQKEIKSILEKLEGKTNYTINVGMDGHAFAVTRIENGRVYVQDPYNTKIESSYTIDELVKLCQYVEITKFD